MDLIALVQKKHKPIPDNIKVIQEFGDEKIIVGNNIRNEVSGISAYLQAEPEAYIEWLKPHGGIWTSNNPMMGNWKYKEIKE